MNSATLFGRTYPALPRDNRPVCTVVIDGEEDFDWDEPVAGGSYSAACMRNVLQLREVLGAYGAVPAYLLTYPVLEDADAVRIIRRQLEKGQCEAGIHLHPWVTPPFDGETTRLASFSGNIGAELEERKLIALKHRFFACFGYQPTLFRAGRYGLGRSSSQLLERHGLEVDTSIAPQTTFGDEGGPDYTGYDYRLFWFGQHRPLLELPLCRSIVGWGGRPFQAVFKRRPHAQASWTRALLTRSRCAERITLSPEGNDARAMRRLIRGLRSAGQPILALSFHGSSLMPGRNPYVQSQRDLHAFYDRLSATLDGMASRMGFGFAAVSGVRSLLQPPPLLGQAA